MTAQRIIRFGIIGCGLMGREFASAAARWMHLREIGREAADRRRLRRQPRRDGVVQPTRCRACATYTDYHDLLADARGRGGLLRRAAQPASAVLSRYPARGQASAGREALWHRPRGVSGHRRRDGAASRPAGALLLGVSLLPRRADDSCRGRGRAASGASSRWRAATGIAATSTPRSRSTGSAASPPAANTAAWAIWACTRSTLPLRMGWRASNVRALLTKIVHERPGPDGADGSLRDVGQRDPGLRGQRRTASPSR